MIRTSSKWCGLLEHDQQHIDDDLLIITLPGFGYKQEHPLFYYLESIFLEKKISYVAIQYGFQKTVHNLNANEVFEKVWYEICDVLNQLNLKQYKNIILIGKSYGTHFIKMIKDTYDIEEAKEVYLTPLNSTIPSSLTQQMYFLYGDQDDAINDMNRKVLEESTAQVKVIKHANHILEVGDYKQDIEIIKDVCHWFEATIM